MAKSGMRVSEASPGARGPGRGESPAARNEEAAIRSFHFSTPAAKLDACVFLRLRVCHEPGWCRSHSVLRSDISFS